MFSMWGKCSLIIAFFFALLQTGSIFYHSERTRPLPRLFMHAQTFWLLNAFLALMSAFLNDDFTLVYAASNSDVSLPFIYKLTALWGGHEGSILLFVFLLSVWGSIFIFRYREETCASSVLSCLGALNALFLLFLWSVSNPFLTNDASLPPQDLNPLLQDPGFIFHPPLLYMGYVGFVIPFAISVCANRRRLDRAVSMIQFFALCSFSILTIGITLGSIWAYHVLGWGGFWFWDPVENISLLPWISGLVTIHLCVIAKKNETYIKQVMVWSSISFLLSVLGTFLVRSGVLISVHSFASDPTRGIFLLMIVAVLLIGLLRVFFRESAYKTAFQSGWNRLRVLELQWILACFVLVLMVFATLYPLILNALTGQLISVGAPYFNVVLPPFVFLMLILMSLIPFTRYHENVVLWRPWLGRVLVSLFLVGSMWGFYRFDASFYMYAAWIAGLMLCLGVLRTLRLYPAMSIAHLGFAIMIMAIAGTTLLSQEVMVKIAPREQVDIGPYRLYFAGTSMVKEANFRGIRAQFLIYKNDRFIGELYPEKRLYPVRNMVMTHIAIDARVFRDVYIALGEPLSEETWSVRAYYKPVIRLVWAGALLMSAGGLIGVFQKRRRTHAS